ncbi:hypothetical protein Jiend_01420 [Micromonospora endophytica]|uniref:hypothetical protein n=1 Tax=Micromonospora endophytica TaxID=515350 RepID=UPI001BB3A07A|nr:hypothetical protein [Micromonospora endophytica]BCJ56720.1 hypothetical protein Jiend_01420 [Micromonospora endophytica]
MRLSSWRAVIAGGGAVLLASAAAVVVGQIPSSAEDTPPSIVEDFSYPGNAEILSSSGIKLIKGDGRIMLADCGSNPNNPPLS